MNQSAANVLGDLLISSDSHVIEDPKLWESRLPASLHDQAPHFSDRRDSASSHPGGWDPSAREKEMAVDGVSAEVLYPTLGLRLFELKDAALQEACFGIYNDWLMEYCAVVPDRLIGIPMISTYNIDHAIAELERCKNGGMRGALVWQVPPPELSFTSDYYDRFWAAAQEMDMPVSLHILTGHGYSSSPTRMHGIDHYRSSVNLKVLEGANALLDLIFSGALERFPQLKLVLVENEIGWLPFFVEQWDRYWERHRKADPVPIDKLPSFYFDRQIYATFFNDPIGGHILSAWGQDNCMWSNDFPHPNSTWPNSREVIARDLGHLPPETLAKLAYSTVTELYSLKVPQPLVV